jgi:hypothetical protein
VYTFKVETYTTDVTELHDVIHSLTYVHRGRQEDFLPDVDSSSVTNVGSTEQPNATVAELVIPEREIMFTINEDENGATFSYIGMAFGNERPTLDLDAGTAGFNNWVKWKAIGLDDSTSVMPGVAIDPANGWGGLVSAAIRIESPQPGDFLDTGGAFSFLNRNDSKGTETFLQSHGELRLGGATTVDVWLNVLRSVRYQGGVPRRLHVTVNNGLSDSFPATVRGEAGGAGGVRGAGREALCATSQLGVWWATMQLACGAAVGTKRIAHRPHAAFCQCASNLKHAKPYNENVQQQQQKQKQKQNETKTKTNCRC